jgi:hypothetical protein
VVKVESSLLLSIRVAATVCPYQFPAQVQGEAGYPMGWWATSLLRSWAMLIGAARQTAEHARAKSNSNLEASVCFYVPANFALYRQANYIMRTRESACASVL